MWKEKKMEEESWNGLMATNIMANLKMTYYMVLVHINLRMVIFMKEIGVNH